jgi:hypothetical protein
MRYYKYLSGAVIGLSCVLIGVGVGLSIPGLVIGGVLCLLVGAMIAAVSGIGR